MAIENVIRDGDETIISILEPTYFGAPDRRRDVRISPQQPPAEVITQEQLAHQLSQSPWGLPNTEDRVSVSGVGIVVFINEFDNAYSSQGWRAGVHTVQGPYLLVDTLFAEPSFEHLCIRIAPDFALINRELADYFARYPQRLVDLSWRQFEILLDAIFRNLGYDTELGSGRNDAGVDLRLCHKDSIGRIVTLVQAKKYDAAYPIKIEPVAALHGVVQREGAHRGLLVTTSRYLPSARRFAADLQSRIILADSGDVARWCAALARNLR